VFLHNCANAIWGLKRPESLHFSILVIFFYEKVLITLQRMQASFIFNQAVVVNLATSQLPPFQNTPPITTVDLLHFVGFLHINVANLPQVVNYGHGEIFTPTLSQLNVLSLLPFP
jgi:hypothetical protein